MKNKLNDLLVFTTTSIKNFKEIGAIVPSSAELSQNISKHIINRSEPLRIIEVGAGTGSFTKEIINKLKPNDQLDIIEMNPAFHSVLQEKFSAYPQVKIHCLNVLDWQPDYEYDLIICGLPFNAFPSDLVLKIFEHFKKIIKNGGIFSYFEYIALAKVKALFTFDRHSDFFKTMSVTKDFRKKYSINRQPVLKNFPPAYIHDLKIEK